MQTQTTDQTSQTAAQREPKPVSAFRREALAKPQPEPTPADVTAAAQAIAGTGTQVEIRLAKPSPTDEPRWLVFTHGGTSKAKVAAALAETEHRVDAQNRCVWLREITQDDVRAAKPAPKTKPQGEPKGRSPRKAHIQAKPTDGHCLCGCGASTKSRFAMGHDARFYSWLAQFQVTGTLPNLASLPEPTKDALKTTELPVKKSYLLDKWVAAKAKEQEAAKAKPTSKPKITKSAK